ncbi:MAG: integration host factor subunit beta [Deltaproteobacteria bacterium]|nr:integration host factor subunit beta [Deltaproteobacteria bacterium]
MNRNDLLIAVAKATGMKIKDTDKMIVMTFHQILLSLARHENVSIMGLGSFRVRKKKPRKARNPRTGETLSVGEKYGIIFRPSKLMKQYVNKSPKVETSTLSLARPRIELPAAPVRKTPALRDDPGAPKIDGEVLPDAVPDADRVRGDDDEKDGGDT